LQALDITQKKFLNHEVGFAFSNFSHVLGGLLVLEPNKHEKLNKPATSSLPCSGQTQGAQLATADVTQKKVLNRELG
jgi:hypothetical protein